MPLPWLFSVFYSFLLLMRSHYLWPQKLQNHTIPVNLEAIQTSTIASKLFQPLYLGYNRVLHYIIHGLQLSNFDISPASLNLFTIFKYILKKLNYLWLLQSSTRTASYGLRLQLQHVPSILLVPLDSLKLNCTWSVSFDSVFSRYRILLWASFYFNTDFGSIAASRLVCSWIGLLRTSQHFLIQHSMSSLHLRLVGLSWFLYLTCKFSLFQIISFPPLFQPFLSNLFHLYNLSSFQLSLLDYLISIENLCRYSEMMKNTFSLHFSSAVQS